MISAGAMHSGADTELSFSAIARSVMISAFLNLRFLAVNVCFSAIARSVMISALETLRNRSRDLYSFSAIARSVMISA